MSKKWCVKTWPDASESLFQAAYFPSPFIHSLPWASIGKRVASLVCRLPTQQLAAKHLSHMFALLDSSLFYSIEKENTGFLTLVLTKIIMSTENDRRSSHCGRRQEFLFSLCWTTHKSCTVLQWISFLVDEERKTDLQDEAEFLLRYFIIGAPLRS